MKFLQYGKMILMYRTEEQYCDDLYLDNTIIWECKDWQINY